MTRNRLPSSYRDVLITNLQQVFVINCSRKFSNILISQHNMYCNVTLGQLKDQKIFTLLAFLLYCTYCTLWCWFYACLFSIIFLLFLAENRHLLSPSIVPPQSSNDNLWARWGTRPPASPGSSTSPTSTSRSSPPRTGRGSCCS